MTCELVEWVADAGMLTVIQHVKLAKATIWGFLMLLHGICFISDTNSYVTVHQQIWTRVHAVNSFVINS